MSRIQSVTTGALAFMTVLAVWQYLQIQDLREANAALAVQSKTGGAGGGSGPIPPPGSGAPKAGPALTAALKEGDAPEAPKNGDPGRAARDAQFQKMRLMDRAQRHDARVLALATKLNLTPEQQAKVRAALEKGSADRDALREAGDARRRDGKQETDEERRAGMAKFAAIETAQEESIAALMSEDQAVAYTDYKAEQKQAAVESRANQQLGELQNKFALTEEQKEAAFQQFARQEQEGGFDPMRIIAEGGDPRTMFEERQKVQMEGLKQILTEEQFQLYSAQEQQKAEMFKAMTGPGGPGGFPFPGFRPGGP